MGDLENPETYNSGPHRLVYGLEAGRKWFAICAVFVAVIGVMLDLFGVTFALIYGPASPATSPITAISVLCLAASIIYSDRRKGRISINVVTAGLAIAVCVIPHAVHQLGLPKIETGAFSGTVGQDTAIIVVLLALSVLLRFAAGVLGLAAGLAGSAFVMNATIGQTYGLPYFDGQMALMTLVSLILVMCAVASLYLHRPLVRVMFLSGAIGARTRMMMGVGFVAPWFCGLLLYHWYGVPEREFPVEATLISAIIWTMMAVTLASGFLHEKADQKRRQAERRLAEQAFHDPLTGLLNRAGLTKALAEQWIRFQLSGVPAAIMLIDLDHFKSVNDTYGHSAGDAVLRSVRAALLPHLRKGDAVGRWGGEEFLCVLADNDLRYLQQISERVRLALLKISDQPALEHGKGPIPVSGSIGVSAFVKGDRGYELAIKRADDSLYVAKRNGRNRVVFDPNLRRTFIRPVRPESALTA